MNEHCVVMHNGENLYRYQMTNDEKVLVENLRHDCMETLDKLNTLKTKCRDGSPYMGRLLDSQDFCIGYKENIGYYVLDGERGVFVMRKNFPELNREKAKFHILTEEFQNAGFQYELMNRRKLQKMWKKTYKVEYDSRKTAFEYAIQKHFDSQSCVIEEIIAEYTDYMNKWFDESHWYFSKKDMSFEENNKTKNSK